MVCDMVFDVIQIRSYWTYAQDAESKFAKDNKTTLSLGYFICAVAAWLLPPLIYMTVSWFLLRGRGKIFTMLMQKNFSKGLPEARCKQFLVVLGIPAFLTIDFLKATCMVYIYIPIFDVLLGFSELIYGRNNRRSQAMPGLKLFEQFGEAIPQLCIALTFYITHYDWRNDLLFGTLELVGGSHGHTQNQSVKLTKTLVSILLSLGSILFGVVMGVKKWPTTRAMVENNTAQFDALTTPRRDLQRLWETVGDFSQEIVGYSTNLAGRTRRRLSRRR